MEILKSRILFCCFLALAFDSQSRFVASAGLTYRFDNTTQTLRLKEDGPMCSKPNQIICEDCHHSLFCISVGDDFEQTPLETCPTGKTCKTDEGCIATPNPECPPAERKGEFPCNSIGVFPDPFDCKKYHFCPPKDQEEDPKKPVEFSTVAVCGKGYGYDFTETFCSEELENDSCDGLQLDWKCDRIGGNDSISPGSSYYYLCKPRQDNNELYPHLYRCPHGEMYSGGTCVKRPDDDELDSSVMSKSRKAKSFRKFWKNPEVLA